MKKHVLMDAFQYVDDVYLDMVETEAKKKRFVSPWGVVVAACICLALFIPVGALAADWFGIRSMILGTPEKELSEQDTQGQDAFGQEGENAGLNGEETQGSESSSAMIGLSGYQNSPELKALEEWNAFRAEYLEEREISSDSVPPKENYAFYGAYNEEMGSQLEAIAEKYGLKLHEVLQTVDQEELAYRVGGEFLGERMQRAWAYIYEDGTFQFDGNMTDVEYPVEYQFRRAVKGTMDDAVLNVGHVTDYEEYQYVTACGEQVMLAIGPYKSLIYGDFEACFISVNVLCGSEHGMTQELLKDMADSVDFTILKEVKTPEMRGDSIP